MPRNGETPPRPKVDAGQLWPGGVATAIVAALVALVGILVCRWLFSIPLLSPQQDGAYGDAHTTGYVLAAAVAALIATAILYLLLLSTPRPMTFFTWIVALESPIYLQMAHQPYRREDRKIIMEGAPEITSSLDGRFTGRFTNYFPQAAKV